MNTLFSSHFHAWLKGSLLSLLMVITPLHAEPAPVYDADAMQTSDELGSAQESQELPSPPSQEGAYLLNQQPVGSPPAPSRPLSVEQRVKRVEQQIQNMQNSETSTRVDSLQGQIQVLRGQLEQLTHQLDQVQNQQKSMYSDLDKRLIQQSTTVKRMASSAETYKASQLDALENKKLETMSKPAVKAQAPAVPVAADASQPNVAEEQQIYQTAYNYIKNKQYGEAVSTLQGMLKKYPAGQFASNAHYWLGELYVLMGKNDQAVNEFTGVVSNFPDSPRVSDALFKVGHIYASQSKWAEAKQTFKKVINHYPGTASARLASEQLKQIKQSGH